MKRFDSEDDPKMTEVKPLVCGDCIHIHEGPNTQNDVMSRVCYRFPPTVFGVLAPQGIAVMSVRPEIRVDTFACGEYDDGTDDAGESVGVVGVKS